MQSTLPDRDQRGINEGFRIQTAYGNVDDFLNSVDAQQVFGQDAAVRPSTDGLTTGSRYFLLKTEVAIVDLKRRTYSLLLRADDARDATRDRVIRRASDDVL